LRIAHLSDLHLHAEGSLGLRDLFGRRIFGAANLLLRRGKLHTVAAAMAAVEAARTADHCIVTGDLTNLALEAEFALAARVLGPLGGYDRLTVVPGNHDYYTPDAVRSSRFERHFGHTLWSEGADRVWPVVKDLEGVRIVALCSPRLCPPMFSYGKLGQAQVEAAARLLADARAQGRFTIVALHHNLHRRGVVNELTGRLLDRDQLRAAMLEAGADLILQGHDHRPRTFDSRRPDGGTMRVAGAGSASLGPGCADIYVITGSSFTVERWKGGQLTR